MKFYLKKKLSLIFGLMIIAFVISSCGKSSSKPSTTTKGHTIQITIKATIPTGFTGVTSVGITGSAVAAGQNTIWKVNNTTQSNQTILSFGNVNFPPGKTTTIVIESVVPIYLAAVSVDFNCIDNGPSGTVSYESVIDGKIQDNDQNVAVTPTNEYQHDRQYGGGQ